MTGQLDQDLGIRLDAASDVPLYRQIADQVSALINGGTLGPGTRLPTTRALALALDTHRNTIVRAFDELSHEGWISGQVGRGSYVLPFPRPLAARELNPTDAARPDRIAEPTRPYRAKPGDDGLPWPKLLSRAVESEPLRRMHRVGSQSAEQHHINLARMQASPDLLPHEDFRRCIDHVMKTFGPDALGYSPGQGLERLRAQIALELGRHGIAADPDDVLITSGSQQALDVICRTLVNPGDVFLTEGRTYSGALNVLTASGADVIAVPTDDDGPDLEALESLSPRGPKGLYLMPNSRNPTGTSLSEARRRAIVAWSREAHVPLIEDDYGADLILDPGPELPHMRSFDPNVLHVGTFSKKLIPALRVGFIVFPPPMRRPLVAMKHAMDLGTSILLQHALAEFLERGLLAPHLVAVCTAYRKRRDALVASLSAALPREVTFRIPDRGVVLWLSLPPNVDPEEAFEEAREEGVLVSPGTVYTTQARASAGLRLSFCFEQEDRLAEGARRLGRALTRIIRRRGERPPRAELFGA